MFDYKDIIKATGGDLAAGTPRKSFSGVSTDSRAITAGAVFIAIRGRKFDGHDFIRESISCGAKAVIYDDPSKVRNFEKGAAYIKVADAVRALGAIACFHRRKFDIPVIAVTGSNGKTTTKEMIAWVLSANFSVHKNKGTQNNLIGVPLTLLEIHSSHDICIVEMGTNRVGEIKQLTQIAEPNFGVITNIGPAHLEHLGDLKGVYKEKIELIKHLSPPGIALLNKGDIYLGKLSRIRSKPFFFSCINNDCDFRATEITYDHNSVTFLFNGVHQIEIKHCALHNVTNALSAIACGLFFGMDINVIRNRLSTFDSPDMRLKEIKLKQCVVFDDSYNSNPQSLKHAIDVLCRQTTGSRRILIMGDMMELGSKSEEFHSYFGHYISKKPVDILVTMGNFSRAASERARKCGMSAACVFHFTDCASVLDFLHNCIKEGDVLLVKGSRSMQMEEIVAALMERH